MQRQVPEPSHWRCREPEEEGHRQQGLERGTGEGLGQQGPLTCRVAVAGLTGHPHVPAIEVLLAVLAVRPGRVVAAMEAAPTVACAAEELPVKRALLRVATAVASCGQETGAVCQQPWHVVGGESMPVSLLVLNEQAARGRSRMEFRPSLIKDMEPKQLILRAEGAPLINTPKHSPPPGKPGCTVTQSWITHWPPSPAPVQLTPGSPVGSLSHNCVNLGVPSDHEVTQMHGKYKSPFIHPFIHF